MKLGTFTKSPVERKRYAVDYTDWLENTETLSSATFSIAPNADPASLEINEHVIDAAGKLLTIFVNAGVTGVSYIATVQVETSDGQIKEDQIVFVVRNQ